MEHLGGCSPTILALRAFRCAPLGAFSAIETMSDPCFISSDVLYLCTFRWTPESVCLGCIRGMCRVLFLKARNGMEVLLRKRSIHFILSV